MAQNVTNFGNVTITPGNDDNNTALGVTLIVISFFVMLGNSVVVIVVVVAKELHIPTLWNLAYMAAWDIATGVVVVVFSVPSALLNRFAYSENMIGWAAVSTNIVAGQGILNIAMALLDRYIAICWPLKYVHIVTLKRFVIAIVVSLGLNILRTCLIIFPDMDFYYNPDIAVCVSNFNDLSAMLAWIAFTFGTGCVMVYCFSRIILDIYRSRKQVQPASNKPQRGVVAFSLSTAMATGVYFISYLPATICVLFNFLHGNGSSPKTLLKLAMVSIVSNSTWNVIIYATMYRPFKEALLHIFCRKYYRKMKANEAQLAFHTRAINRCD